MEKYMKLYVIISDTHGDIYTAKKVIARYPQIDGLIHLGDYYKDAHIIKSHYPELNVIMVPGNCDFVFDTPTDSVFEVEGKRILITHGHLYNVKSGLENLERKAVNDDIDLVLFGHTHCPLQESRSNITFVNPGSIGNPRGTLSPTYALLEVSKNGLEVRILEA
jgi:putative phosphoesterase